MAHDPLGRRVQVVHDGTTAMFVHDGAEARAVLGVAGALERWWATDPGGGLLAEVDVASGTVRDALLDHLGTRRGWVTSGALELDPADPLGNRASGTPSRVEPGGLTWHQQDPTGLVYARARYLDPATGRFLSEDPLAAENAYTYAASSPCMAWDPRGEAEAIEYAAHAKAGETRATAIGRAMHKMWDYGPGWEKEFRLLSGRRVDAINHAAKKVLELKPNNPRAVARGWKQLQGYLDELGEGWTGDIVTY